LSEKYREKRATPHISIEYSANLEQAIAPARLVEVVHQAALNAGVFATSRVRTFAQPVADFGPCV